MNTGAQAGATQRKEEEGEGCLAYIGKLVATAVGIIVVVVLGITVVIYITAGGKKTDDESHYRKPS
ncbi:MAG: hypothetical protein NTW87_03880 [Planctomycetota bacterium]|nr:hypothetical protein [Planctomycetota bacterium]